MPGQVKVQSLKVETKTTHEILAAMCTSGGFHSVDESGVHPLLLGLYKSTCNAILLSTLAPIK